MSIVLKPARDADLLRLAQLHAECFPEDAWSPGSLATVLAMPGAGGRVAYGDSGEAGAGAAEGETICGLLLDQCLGSEGEILTLGVAPAWRRRGIAHRLLADLIMRARAAGVTQLALEVAADNAVALRIYQAFGFVRHGTRRGYYRLATGSAVDAWRLGLELPPLTIS